MRRGIGLVALLTVSFHANGCYLSSEPAPLGGPSVTTDANTPPTATVDASTPPNTTADASLRATMMVDASTPPPV